ncbi:GIY-YIG nuclease family protein [uncultured Methanoregula sp.]|uniref:GIY-YIG nuclease family protein n=1 Tax=uncultured Methanoregula sp. TaxID=1005933 RepID=UPI002AAB9F92|nr:GIY-YIG nuclease family protein [uncultured Methanoregula sp.]
MDKGTYCLVFRNPGCTIMVGALGEIAFRKGWHIYVGSALGSGGLTRLERHITLSRDRNKRPKWHVDYLSTGHSFTLRYTVHAVTEGRFECRLADTLAEPGIPGFGCSDCTCKSHLFYRTHDPVHEIEIAFRSLGLAPVTTTIKNP